jgi:hypothetical protein
MILTAGIESDDGKSYFGETTADGRGGTRGTAAIGDSTGAPAGAAATTGSAAARGGAFQTAVNLVT